MAGTALEAGPHVLRVLPVLPGAAAPAGSRGQVRAVHPGGAVPETLLLGHLLPTRPKRLVIASQDPNRSEFHSLLGTRCCEKWPRRKSVVPEPERILCVLWVKDSLPSH